MPWRLISRVLDMPDGSMVWAEESEDGTKFRVVCNGCPELRNLPRRSAAGAILAASYHSEHDPNEHLVPLVDDPN